MTRIERQIPENKEAEEGRLKAELVYIGGEFLTPPSFLEFSLLQKLGRISSDYQIVPTLTTPKASVEEESAEFLSLPSNCSRRDFCLELIKNLPPQEEKTLLTCLTNYLDYCWAKKEETTHLPLRKLGKIDASPYLYNQLLELSLRHHSDPREALEAGRQLLDQFVKREINPFSYQKGVPDEKQVGRIRRSATSLQRLYEEEIESFKDQACSGPEINFNIPILYRDPGKPYILPGETRVINRITLRRPLGRLRILEGNNISIAIAGPLKSGKSTLAASLVVEVNKILAQAMSHFEFADLQLRCVPMDLDKMTPDLTRILNQNRGERTKTPWTRPLALETAKEFLKVRQESNIIIADAPGQTTDITDIVTGPADLSILLIRADDEDQWKERRKRWGKALQNIGIRLVVLLHSRIPGEINPITGGKITSALTSFSWAKSSQLAWLKQPDWISRVGGRIVGLSREVKENDPFIPLLTQILLFDLLPQAVIERKRQSLNYLEQISSDYERKISSLK